MFTLYINLNESNILQVSYLSYLNFQGLFWTNFTIGTAKSGLLHNLYLFCLLGRINSLISSGAIPIFSLNISHARKFVYGIRQSHLFLAIRKRWISYHYKLFLNIFHEFDWSYYFSHDYETSKLIDKVTLKRSP